VDQEQLAFENLLMLGCGGDLPIPLIQCKAELLLTNGCSGDLLIPLVQRDPQRLDFGGYRFGALQLLSIGR